MNNINWGNIKLLIFDVDGTLYDQQKLRRRMFLSLFLHYLPRPHKLEELRILKSFRKEREKNRGRQAGNLEHDQYEWCRIQTGADTTQIRTTVTYWMHEYPLRFLAAYVFPGIPELFNGSRQLQLPVAVLSDYPAEEKLRSMGLTADLVVSSTHPGINSLKPDPQGLLYIARHFKLKTQQCLYIGDRYDTDHEAARRADMNCVIADRGKIYHSDFYNQILNQLAG